jgi:hypothetical protein
MPSTTQTRNAAFNFIINMLITVFSIRPLNACTTTGRYGAMRTMLVRHFVVFFISNIG